MTFFKKLQPFPNITCSRVRFGSEITLLHKIAIHLLGVLSTVSNKKNRKCELEKSSSKYDITYCLLYYVSKLLSRWTIQSIVTHRYKFEKKNYFKSKCTQHLQALFQSPRCTAEKFPNFRISTLIIFGEIKSMFSIQIFVDIKQVSLTEVKSCKHAV